MLSLKENSLFGGINIPLNLDEAKATLWILSGIEWLKLDCPVPINSSIPKLLALASWITETVSEMVPIWFGLTKIALQALRLIASSRRALFVTNKSSPTIMSCLPMEAVRFSQSSQASWSKGSSIDRRLYFRFMSIIKSVIWGPVMASLESLILYLLPW